MQIGYLVPRINNTFILNINAPTATHGIVASSLSPLQVLLTLTQAGTITITQQGGAPSTIYSVTPRDWGVPVNIGVENFNELEGVASTAQIPDLPLSKITGIPAPTATKQYLTTATSAYALQTGIPTTDLTGTISTAQIADNAINRDKLFGLTTSTNVVGRLLSNGASDGFTSVDPATFAQAASVNSQLATLTQHNNDFANHRQAPTNFLYNIASLQVSSSSVRMVMNDVQSLNFFNATFAQDTGGPTVTFEMFINIIVNGAQISYRIDIPTNITQSGFSTSNPNDPQGPSLIINAIGGSIAVLSNGSCLTCGYVTWQCG